MKKIIAIIITIITALGFTLGLAGCRDKDTVICKKDFGTSIGAVVWESDKGPFTVIKVEEHEEQLKYVYSFFKSVKYRYTEELSDDEKELLKKFNVLFYFDNPPILKRTEIPEFSATKGYSMYCFVDESGKSILSHINKYYVSEESAVDYNALIEYYNNNVKGN